jgi:proliferating cell nuclear antigen
MPVDVLHAIPPSEECLFFIQTFQGSIVRTLFEVLKDVIYESLLLISPERIKITTMDSSKSSLVYMNLKASSFEAYHCNEEFKVGVSMLSLFKLIKSISSKTDIVTFFLHKDRPYELGIGIHNEYHKSSTVFSLKMLDLNHLNINIPSFEYDKIVTLPSTTLQKLCRDMMNLSSFVLIESSPNKLTLSVQGDFASQSTTFQQEEEEGEEDEKQQTEESFNGLFSLKFLNLFGRSSSLSPNVTMYLKKSHPMVLSYEIGSLGELKFLLTPQLDDDDDMDA